MKVKVILYQPFSGIIDEKEIIINYKEKEIINLKKLLKLLLEKKPKLKKHLISDNNEKMFRNFIVVKNNEMLKLDSKIIDEDILKIFSPLNGG